MTQLDPVKYVARTRFTCEISDPPKTQKIDLNDAFRLLSEIGLKAEVTRLDASEVHQLVILRDDFMRAAYASNRPHRRTRKPKPTTQKELV